MSACCYPAPKEHHPAEEPVYPGFFLHQIDLRKLQGKGRSPLLPLGTIPPDVDPVDLYAEIISVRSHGGQLHPKIPLPVPGKLILKLRRRHTWLVQDLQLLDPASKAFMKPPCDLVKLLHKGFPLPDDLLSVIDHLHIPDIQGTFQPGVHITVFEKTVSLVHDVIVAGQLRDINTIQLTKLRIQKTSSLSRSILDNIKILRRKNTRFTTPSSSLALRIGSPLMATPFALFFRRCISILYERSPFFTIIRIWDSSFSKRIISRSLLPLWDLLVPAR